MWQLLFDLEEVLPVHLDASRKFFCVIGTHKIRHFEHVLIVFVHRFDCMVHIVSAFMQSDNGVVHTKVACPKIALHLRDMLVSNHRKHTKRTRRPFISAKLP
uniref:Uncharacterized protein n=1 Tax=Parascaris equorum TaxID=6256 RepID=A0A914RV90_PAREQ